MRGEVVYSTLSLTITNSLMLINFSFALWCRIVGALGEIYIKVRVPEKDKPGYHTMMRLLQMF